MGHNTLCELRALWNYGTHVSNSKHDLFQATNHKANTGAPCVTLSELAFEIKSPALKYGLEKWPQVVFFCFEADRKISLIHDLKQWQSGLKF